MSASEIWTPGSAAALPVTDAPIITPHHVRGFVGHDERRPDRLFYVLWLEDDTVWEIDGYRLGPMESPDDASDVLWSINLFCPKCRQNIRLDSTKKHIHVHRGRGLETAEPMRCPWPAEFGGLCSFAAVLELPKPSLREVRLTNGTPVRLDAVAKRA
jgi:hypothetical protein